MSIWIKRLTVTFFPLTGLALLLVFLFLNWSALAHPHSVTSLYIENSLEGKVGFGRAGNYMNSMTFDQLEPGDLVLGGYPDCAYGRFSHAAIYLGDGKVAEAYADFGVLISQVEHFRTYSQVCLLRVNASPAVKKNAVNYIQSHTGDLFYPLAFKPGERIWNCTKIMWKAYADQGFDLDSGKDLWVTPDSIYRSTHVTIIGEMSL